MPARLQSGVSYHGRAPRRAQRGAARRQRRITRTPAYRGRQQGFARYHRRQVGPTRNVGRAIARQPQQASQRRAERQRRETAHRRRIAQQRKRRSSKDRNAERIVRVGEARKAPEKHIRAALAAAIVESGVKNLNHGDRDSVGILQQRPSQGWGSRRQLRNPSYAAFRFYEAARQADRPGLAPGTLAQAVQRSAYPARYGQRLPAADAMLRRIRRRRSSSLSRSLRS